METYNRSKTHFNKEKVNRLLALAINLSRMDLTESNTNGNDFIDWTSEINDADNMDLIALISLLDTRDKETSREVKALRESVIAQAGFKNAILISETLKKLDKTATYLTVVSIVLSVIAAGAAILQLVR